MKRMTCWLAIGLGCVSPSLWADGLGVAGGVGTLGFSGQLAYGLTDQLTLRGMVNGFHRTQSDTYQDVDYDAELSMNSGGLLVDWHVFSGAFRLTAGLMKNRFEFDLTGRPSNGTYNINGQIYQSSDIGTLTGRIDYDRNTVPYAGLGWGNLGKSGWHFMADLGVLFTGKADVSLTGTCSPSLPAPACAQLQQDIAAEQQKLKEDADSSAVYPLASIQLGYTF